MATGTRNTMSTDKKLDLLRTEISEIRVEMNSALARLEKTIADQAEEIEYLKRLTSLRA